MRAVYAIVERTGQGERVVEKWETREDACLGILEWIERAGEQGGNAAAENLSLTLSVEILH